MTHNIPDSPPPSYNSISRQSSTRAPTSDISSNEETKNNDSGSASTKDQALGSSILDDVSEDEVRDVSDGNPPPISFSMGAVPPSQTTDPRSEETQWEDVEGGRPPRRHTTGHRDNVGVVFWCDDEGRHVLPDDGDVWSGLAYSMCRRTNWTMRKYELTEVVYPLKKTPFESFLSSEFSPHSGSKGHVVESSHTS
ncbi:hypothetical protein M231_04524 [Tremella mesenterica]|uniref:Uncharacterized protein n=1 Tax=Tremella mesenterica TaxID=5217 RepID=A0A4Q1BKQ2_TREME|nr:hypothetical protein M231_04524 [Tremella mesenterica]